MTDSNPHDQKFLTDLLSHPGWPVLVRTLEQHSNGLIEALLTADENKEKPLLQRWRAMETLRRECLSLKSYDDLVQLGLETNE